MAIFRCKMCGGELVIEEGSSVCVCEYCGTRQTVPKADDEKKMTLFNRASRLLRNCEFDKASGVFETIVADFPEEAEAYWGLVLCKYGIEYVDDPGTGKKVPTCHRSSFESVLDDPNFEQACEYGDATARRVYRDEARQIEEIRKGIIEVSGREEPYDVFISYKETDDGGDRTLDSVLAQDIYNALMEKGYRVFFSRISLESKLGTEYEPYIFAALNSARVMVVVGTDYENFDSVWVKNEWSRFLKLIASGQKKTLIPVFKNMDAYDMPKEFSKLAAQDMGKVGAMQDLIRGIEKLVPKKKDTSASASPSRETVVVQGEGDMKTTAALKRGELALEAREWDKARQYFDQALTLDAESPDAYFGIALAELSASSPEDYLRSVEAMVPRTETLNLAQDTPHIQKMIKEQALQGYLTEAEIQKYYTKTVSYPSIVKGQKEIENRIKQTLENNRNLSLALRFASGEKKQKLEGLKKSVFEKLEERNRKAKKQDEEALVKAKKEYADYLKSADRNAQSSGEAARKKQRADYNAAISAEKNAKTVAEYKNAITLFQKNPTYLDTKDHIKYCEQAIQTIQAKEVSKKKRTAITIITVLSTIIGLTLLLTLVIVPGYKKAHKTVGAIVKLGNYEQDNNSSNGKEPIEWIVLAEDGNKRLLISRYALDSQPYNKKNTDVTWETCTLRDWLNSTFLNTAFTAEEKKAIMTISVDNSKSQGYSGWSTSGGNNTKDKIFLLSYVEAENYFNSDDVRICKPTAYAVAQNTDTNNRGNCWWWLRSPGSYQNRAGRVLAGGSLGYSNDVNHGGDAVRPAFWIDLESDIF